MSYAEPRLICLLGAESTGKTTLAQALAQHFGGLWVPEVLRQFCDQHLRTPRQDEQAGLLAAQVAAEDAALLQARRQGAPYVFCDTAPLLLAAYSAYYFADESLYPLAHRWHQRYALTLLLSPDLPWTPDGLLRDGPQVRTAVHTLLLRQLGGCASVVLVQGSGAARWQAGVAAVNAVAATAPSASPGQAAVGGVAGADAALQ